MNFSGFSRLATEISSSISSQWIPIPPPINPHSLLCFSVALKSRGNHTSGTDTVRPSSSTTVKASLEHETSTAIASLLTTEVCIPSLQESAGDRKIWDYARVHSTRVKLLFDQNLSHRLVNVFAADFPGSIHVRELGLEKALGSAVWEFAKEHGLVIVSKDSDSNRRKLGGSSAESIDENTDRPRPSDVHPYGATLRPTADASDLWRPSKDTNSSTRINFAVATWTMSKLRVP